MPFWRHICVIFLFICCIFGLAFGQANFSSSSIDYDCDGDLICLGDAHMYPESPQGTLSLTREETGEGDNVRSSGGIAYYNKPIRFMNPSNGQAASFNTSFSCYQVVEVKSDENDGANHGDGFTFVISANNSTTGAGGDGFFGFFDRSGKNDFKSVVVEFDSVIQPDYPILDESANHVSFDLGEIAPVKSRNADDVQIFLFDNRAFYIWVEYEAKAQNLEVRISNDTSRPPLHFLQYQVNLSQYVEEYMWMGFSAGHGIGWSYYYIGDWEFESHGIPTESQASPSRQKKSSNIGVVVLIPVAALTLILGCCICCFVARRRRAAPNGHASDYAWWKIGSRFHKIEGDDVMLQMAGMGEGYCFSYEELKAATGGFSEDKKLGQGGFGSVYHGVLPRSNLPIAVKRIKQESEQGEKEFKVEVSVMSQVRHRNLIQLLGWCIKGGKYYIVYEVMPNGSLDKFLFGPEGGSHDVLPWPLKWSIIEGTAAAVDYLHRGWKQQVIHRDIKASNILLDDKWNAKLGDFGLARVADHQQIPSTTGVAGTYGYIAPECMVSGKFTDKSDVYAFGVVALETACGRKSIALNVEPDEIILVDWVWRCLMAEDLFRVVDPDLSEYDKGQMEVLLLMGLFCAHPNPLARPSMRNVVQVLLGDAPVPPAPTTNPGPVYNEAFRDSLIPEKSRTSLGLSSISSLTVQARKLD